MDRTIPAGAGGTDDDAASEPADVRAWEGVEETAEFRNLVGARLRFIVPATIFFLVYYFALPLSNGLAPDLMKTKVFGNVNLAYLFALSEFFMAWILAWLYIRRANNVFDRLAEGVRAAATRLGGRS